MKLIVMMELLIVMKLLILKMIMMTLGKKLWKNQVMRKRLDLVL